jgi:hypothetical protein
VSRRLLTRARTALALGVGNIARVASYRLRLRYGVHPVQRLRPTEAPRGPFYAPVAAEPAHGRAAPRRSTSSATYFGWLDMPEDHIPDWFRNPFTGLRGGGTDSPWWTLPDFDEQLGDVKTVWEASRMDWAMRFAQRAVAEGGSVSRLNEWLDDWSARNPPYRGHNWKCAQEASVRVMHLAVASLILGQTTTALPGLVALLQVHLRRIAPTVAYATAQDNNHGTSEAAALMIGGSWLERLGLREGQAWHRAGRQLLADRAARLVSPDGSFSQHSVNYHRLMLDTLSLAEVWRRHLALPPFAPVVLERAAAAAEWLRVLTDERSGDAPNLGANDGANLLPLTGADFRDYRPSVALAVHLFHDRAVYAGVRACEDQLHWLGLVPAQRLMPAPGSRLLDDGGYAVLHHADAMAVLRYPRFRFRPSHADALHVDLWHAGENLLRDGGTYAYDADDDVLDAFAGVRGHNTIQLDGREQMPRLGRFLWGDWLRTTLVAPLRVEREVAAAGAGYRDASGGTHARRVELRSDSLQVSDVVTGVHGRAVLRWRLRPGNWQPKGHALSDGRHRIAVTANVPITRFELVDGWESRYYRRRTELPVLEVEIATSGAITTEYRWRR